MLTIISDDDLDLIFSRFGKVVSCEVIRDKRTGDSLQYAFIEFEDQKACEQAYFKMQGVLIDDHRIHVDFSQSVRSTSSQSNKSRSDRCVGLEAFGYMADSDKFEAQEPDWWIRRCCEPGEEATISSCGHGS